MNTLVEGTTAMVLRNQDGQVAKIDSAAGRSKFNHKICFIHDVLVFSRSILATTDIQRPRDAHRRRRPKRT